MFETKHIKETTELKDGQYVTTTETTTIDKDGKKVREVKEIKHDD